MTGISISCAETAAGRPRASITATLIKFTVPWAGAPNSPSIISHDGLNVSIEKQRLTYENSAPPDASAITIPCRSDIVLYDQAEHIVSISNCVGDHSRVTYTLQLGLAAG